MNPKDVRLRVDHRAGTVTLVTSLATLTLTKAGFKELALVGLQELGHEP